MMGFEIISKLAALLQHHSTMHSYTVKFLRTLQEADKLSMIDKFNTTNQSSYNRHFEPPRSRQCHYIYIAVIYTMSMLISTHAFYYIPNSNLLSCRY